MGMDYCAYIVSSLVYQDGKMVSQFGLDDRDSTVNDLWRLGVMNSSTTNSAVSRWCFMSNNNNFTNIISLF